MKIRQIVLATVTVMLLTISPVWADRENGDNGNGNDCQGNSCGGGGNFMAPEIDAASGTSAIALLAGALLLAGERSRSRRS